MCDLRDYCRLCAGYQPTVKLVELQNDEKECQDIIKKLSRFNLQVNLNDTVLNNLVCITCVTSLESAFYFVAAVEQGQLALDNLFSVRQITEGNNEENFSEIWVSHCSYEDSDSLTETYGNNIKSRCEKRKHQDNDSYVNIENIGEKNAGKSNEKEDSNCSYEESDSLTDTYDNIVKSRGEKSKHHNKEFSDDDSYVYSYNISEKYTESNEKNKEKNLDDSNCSYDESNSLTETFGNIVKSRGEHDDDSYVYTENIGEKYTCKSNEKNEENLNLKSGNVKQNNESVSDGENFIYEFVTDKNVLATKVKSKKVVCTSKSAPSISKNCKKSNNGKKQSSVVYRWKRLPLSELELTWNDYTWMCSYCETQFPSLDELRTHSMQYHNVCNPYQCTDCKVKKSHLHSFLVHVKKHRQYLKFSCYKCPMKFSSVLEASEHQEVHMNSDFICFGCYTNFSSKDEWFMHTKRFYKNTWAKSILAIKNDSPSCYICHKVCKNKNELNGHLLTHNNNICEICGKCFYYKSNLQYHLVSHSDARPFQCEICTSRFKTKKRLKLHISTHDGNKPFTCDTCGKCFRLKTHLVKHMIIHTDNLPHGCMYCEKRFRHKGHLNQHIRQHTGVKPYSCDICKRDFTNWANCNKHMKRKHDMTIAKKKRTPEGTFPIDPNTGEVIDLSEKKITQCKQKILELKNKVRKRVTKNRKALPT